MSALLRPSALAPVKFRRRWLWLTGGPKEMAHAFVVDVGPAGFARSLCRGVLRHESKLAGQALARRCILCTREEGART